MLWPPQLLLLLVRGRVVRILELFLLLMGESCVLGVRGPGVVPSVPDLPCSRGWTVGLLTQANSTHHVPSLGGAAETSGERKTGVCGTASFQHGPHEILLVVRPVTKASARSQIDVRHVTL